MKKRSKKKEVEKWGKKKGTKKRRDRKKWGLPGTEPVPGLLKLS